MKKIIVMMLVIVMSVAVLSGCGNNTGNTDNIGGSDAVSIESTESEDITTSEETSVEESENPDETVMFSADEVMAHIDTLIAQYIYNDPEHIKALVIAANLDYISEEDLGVILTAYGYTMNDLSVLYDECILDNANSYEKSYQYVNGNIDTLLTEEKYTNRITIESIMLNDTDKEMSKWFDELLIDRTVGETTSDRSEKFAEIIKGCGTDLTSAERTIYSYSFGIYTRGGSYEDYLDNSYAYYIDTNM